MHIVADVRAGTSFREGVRHREDGTIAVIQAGDVQADGLINLSGLLRTREMPVKGEPRTLTAGEVLLQCRGMSYKAAVVPPHDVPMVASASVYILTVRPIARPAYLAHFLNDSVTQTELRKLATGATIANLRRVAVEQLEVLVPTLEDQDKIVALAESLHKLGRLEARIAELRRIELRALLEERAERNRKRANASGS